MVEGEWAEAIRIARERNETDEVVGSSRFKTPSPADEVAEDRLDDIEPARARIAAHEVARFHRARAVDHHDDCDALALDLCDCVASTRPRPCSTPAEGPGAVRGA